MDPLLQFLQRFSYTRVETANLQTLANYISYIEKLASTQKDPTVLKIIKSLRTTPINKIGYQLSLVERHLTLEAAKKEQKANAKANQKQQPKSKPQSAKFKIYKA